MDIPPVPEAVARAGLRAIKMVCYTDGGIVPLERSFLEGIQRYVLRTSFDLDNLEPIDGEELASAVPPGEARARIVGGMVLASAIDGDTSATELAVIEEYAAALGVKPDVLQLGRHLAHERILLARIDIARRSLPGFMIKGVLREDGLPGLIKQLLPALGVANKATAARYRALEASPAGTLGRAYYDFVTSNDFTFPGEPHAGPEIIVVHDLHHVLGGYGTSAEEEVLVAAFQAGTHHGDPFHQMMFALAQFHLGISMSPVTAAQTLQLTDPGAMVAALARGNKVTKDLWAMAPWELFPRPLDELRRELNIEPR